MTTAACLDFCNEIWFIFEHDVKKALGRAYSKVRPNRNDTKKYLEGYRYCSVCEKYLRNFEGLKCPCCGWVTRDTRRNLRGKLIQKRYSFYNKQSDKKAKMHKVPVKEDILRNMDKINEILNS